MILISDEMLSFVEALATDPETGGPQPASAVWEAIRSAGEAVATDLRPGCRGPFEFSMGRVDGMMAHVLRLRHPEGVLVYLLDHEDHPYTLSRPAPTTEEEESLPPPADFADWCASEGAGPGDLIEVCWRTNPVPATFQITAVGVSGVLVLRVPSATGEVYLAARDWTLAASVRRRGGRPS